MQKIGFVPSVQCGERGAFSRIKKYQMVGDAREREEKKKKSKNFEYFGKVKKSFFQNLTSKSVIQSKNGCI